MKVEFIENTSKFVAADRCPWATVIQHHKRGFLCFEAAEDYRSWIATRNAREERAILRKGSK
jgi:hypothetical protein